MRKFTEDKLLIASGNAGKIREISSLLDSFDVKVISAKDYNLPEPEEDGSTFIENAQIKARYYGQATGLPALADDSGLCVAALDGQPGIYSARWAGPDKDFTKAMQHIQTKLADNDNSQAKFICALSLYWPDTQEIVSFEGKVEGNLTFPARGDHGFGYDPIFIPNEYEETFAQLSPQIKDKISHRADAFSKFINDCFY